MARFRDRLRGFLRPLPPPSPTVMVTPLDAPQTVAMGASTITAAPAAVVAERAFTPAQAATTAALGTKRAIDATYAAKPLMGGRQTQPENFNPFGLAGPWSFVPKKQFAQLDVTELDVTMFSADQLLALLPDLDPTISKAVWSFMREAGTEVTFQALTLGGEEDAVGQAILDDLILGINQQAGGIDGVIRQLELTAYLQGACCIDVAPTKSLKDLDDIYVVNPDSIFFERDMDQRPVPFQRQQIWGSMGGGAGFMPFRMLNEETFIYVPVDPYVDDPYGRAPIAPSLQVVFALAQVLRDLAKVVHHQGWPKIDVSLIWELLEPTIPDAIKQDEQRVQNWIQARITEVVTAYNAMAPEDAFVHLDYVKVDSTKAAAGSKLFDVHTVVQVFLDQLIQACKSLPIFHGGGSAKGETETYGTVEYDIYVASVSVLRDIVAEVLVRGLTVAMELRGHPCVLKHEWAPIQRTLRSSDAQAEAQEIENEVNKRDQGWITQDDASNSITGSDAVAPPPSPSAWPMAPPHPMAQVIAPGVDDTVPPDQTGDGPAPTADEVVKSGRGGAFAYLLAAARANGHAKTPADRR